MKWKKSYVRYSLSSFLDRDAFYFAIVFFPQEFASIQKAIQLPLPHVLEPKPLAPFLLAMMGAKPSA